MTRTKLILGTFMAAVLAGAAMLAFAQRSGEARSAGAPPSGNQTMFFETKIGSFKLVNGTGQVTIKFSGTIVISGLEGTATTSGAVKKEYEHDKPKKAGYHGTGTITVDGKFKGIQWFGTNMSGKWTGTGLARLYGEYDDKQETGYYWYAHKTEKFPWHTYQSDPELPENPAKNPRPRSRGGG